MPEARAQRPETPELAVDQMGIPSPKMVVRSRVVTIMKTYEDGCQSEIFP